jgi:hypothetical protein
MPWGKMVTVFITSILFLKVGIGSAIGFQLNFTQTILSAGLSGVFCSFFFTYVSAGAIKWSEKWLDKKFPSRKKKRKTFTWKNRFIIKAKKSFGLLGIAAIAPILLSIPLGSFLAVRFFGDKFKVFCYLSISSIAWAIILYFSFGGWLFAFK